MMARGRAMDGDGSRAIALYQLWGLGALVVAIVVATPFAFRAGGDNVHIVLAVVTGLVALAATTIAERAPSRQALLLIAAVAVATRGFLIIIDPLFSTDIYRYVWDGWVQGEGINPYRYYPKHEALAALRDGAVFPHINRSDYAVTIYPPVAQMFFLVVTQLGGGVTAMKAALVGCEAVSVAMIVLMLRRLRLPPTRIVAYAWHPLPIWEIASSGHVDALMVALMMVGLWLAYANRALRGAATIALGALAKPFALLALPAIWRRWDWRMPALVIAVVALCYAPYLSAGTGVLGFLTTGYLREEQFLSGNMVLPLMAWRALVGTLRGDTIVYFTAAGIAMILLAFVAARREPKTIDTGIADINSLLLAALLLLSPNYPWYFLIVIPFVALRGGAIVWTVSIAALLLHEEVEWDYYVPILIRKSLLYAAVLATCTPALARAWRAWRANR